MDRRIPNMYLHFKCTENVVSYIFTLDITMMQTLRDFFTEVFFFFTIPVMPYIIPTVNQLF